jgi:hypothetical protein
VRPGPANPLAGSRHEGGCRPEEAGEEPLGDTHEDAPLYSMRPRRRPARASLRCAS